MRLGIDASNLREGGGVTHLVELLRHAQPIAQGIERIVVWGGAATLACLEERKWLECVHKPMLDGPLPARVYWQTVRLSALAADQCDVLLIPGGSYAGTFRPTVTMCRNMLPFESAERRRYGFSWMRLKLRLLNISQAQSFRRADGMIFLTEYARQTVLNQIGRVRGRQAVIPHGLDERFRLAPRPQRPTDDYSFQKPFRLVYVSTIDLYKHQWNVAEAVARLRKSGMPIELELVGSAYPPALRRLQEVTRRIDPDGQFIHYRGAEAYSNLPACYHRADLFVFASSCENMPNVLLEAMASGLPIACSKRGPMPDILGDAGDYFDPEQPVQIAQAMANLMGDTDRRRAAAEAAFERAQTYSWQRCADATLKFIVETTRAAGRVS